MKASTATSNIPTTTSAGAATTTGSSFSTDEAFFLDGPSRPVDARLQAWRRDLADISLAGRVFAPHYARAMDRGCGSHAAFVRIEPDEQASAVSELLPGEDFAVLEYAGGWAWGFCRADHIVGYVEAIALAEPIAPTHIVCERDAPVAPDDRITSPVIAHLPMGSLLHGRECGACLTTEYGCVALSHLRPLADPEGDPVAVAERLKGAPWLDGGRSAGGIDATGLVQLALAVSGVKAPRLADQLVLFGAPATGPAERGDIVLGNDVAGLMIDDLMMIHVSRTAGKVVVEPLSLHPNAELRRLV